MIRISLPIHIQEWMYLGYCLVRFSLIDLVFLLFWFWPINLNDYFSWSQQIWPRILKSRRSPSCQDILWHLQISHKPVLQQPLEPTIYRKITNCFCFNNSVSWAPLLRSCWVAASRSEPNWAKAATSLYWANYSLSLPATCFMALIWAADPTLETDRPTLIAGLIPL